MSVPIRIFGSHDERTVAQLERCAAAGAATRAVLCADGHLGYSQPIGGAIADFAAVLRELAAAGIELRGGAADEAPAAYKRLPEVLLTPSRIDAFTRAGG